MSPFQTSFKHAAAKGSLCIAAIVAATMISAAHAPSVAQDVQRIAAIVNDQVISRYDVEQRVHLVISTSRLNDSQDIRRRLRQQVLRSLIDESLQLQAAKRHSIRVSRSDLKRAFSYIERQNKVPPGGLERYLNQRQIPLSALENQIRAEIAWSKLVSRRLGRNVRIGDEEVDEVLTRLKENAGRSQQRISEIFLPVDTPEQEEEVRRSALGLLQQLREGAAFSAMARQFSRGATANQGGAVGWVQPGQLDTELEQVIAKLAEKEISEPIRSAGGYYLIQLHDRRKIAGAAKDGVKLSLKQLLLPVTASADKQAVEADFKAQEVLAKTVADSANGCGEIEAVAKEMPSAETGDLGTVSLSDLPENIASAVKDLEIGRFSAPLRRGQAVMLLMVCKREAVKGEGPNRQSVSDSLARQRLSMLAQRYLRDLRRSAVVELR